VNDDDSIKYDLPWVEIDNSLQWRYFTKTARLLQERKNNVYVLVGPFNEHKLNKKSLEAYSKVKSDIERRLIDNKINYYIPPPLPEQLFADASHPTADGYKLLAGEIIKRIEKR
jgi:lysophospholipase L1-like esterase